MAELIRIMNCAIRLEVVEDKVEINITTSSKPNRTSQQATMYYPIRLLNIQSINLLCQSIDSVFPIGEAGIAKLAKGLLEIRKGERK